MKEEKEVSKTIIVENVYFVSDETGKMHKCKCFHIIDRCSFYTQLMTIEDEGCV